MTVCDWSKVLSSSAAPSQTNMYSATGLAVVDVLRAGQLMQDVGEMVHADMSSSMTLRCVDLSDVNGFHGSFIEVHVYVPFFCVLR